MQFHLTILLIFSFWHIQIQACLFSSNHTGGSPSLGHYQFYCGELVLDDKTTNLITLGDEPHRELLPSSIHKPTPFCESESRESVPGKRFSLFSDFNWPSWETEWTRLWKLSFIVLKRQNVEPRTPISRSKVEIIAKVFSPGRASLPLTRRHCMNFKLRTI